MTEMADNLLLRELGRLDEKVDLVIEHLHELARGVGRLETRYAKLSAGLDRIGMRIDRIETRLDCIARPAAPGSRT